MFAWVNRPRTYIPRQPDKYDLELEEFIKNINEIHDAINKKNENKEKLKVISWEEFDPADGPDPFDGDPENG